MSDLPFRILPVEDATHQESFLRRSMSTMNRQLRALGFWTAVTLPFLYGPMLVSGLDSASETLAFVALFVINLVALAVGHDYRVR